LSDFQQRRRGSWALILLSGRVAFSGARGFGDEVFTKNLEGVGRGFLQFLWVFLKGVAEKPCPHDGNLMVKSW
jgi:hypothetical protein